MANKKPMANTIWIQDVSEETASIGAVVLNVYYEDGEPVITTNKDGIEQVTANIYQAEFAYIDVKLYAVMEKLALVKTSPVDGKKYIKLVFDILNPTVSDFDSWK